MVPTAGWNATIQTSALRRSRREHCPRHRRWGWLILGLIMGTTCAMPDNEDLAKATEELSVVSALRELVMEQNACALDGVQIRYDTFLPCM